MKQRTQESYFKPLPPRQVLLSLESLGDIYPGTSRVAGKVEITPRKTNPVIVSITVRIKTTDNEQDRVLQEEADKQVKRIKDSPSSSLEDQHMDVRLTQGSNGVFYEISLYSFISDPRNLEDDRAWENHKPKIDVLIQKLNSFVRFVYDEKEAGKFDTEKPPFVVLIEPLSARPLVEPMAQ